ncbi:substrate-binding domain-containing protein [Amnibacterium kyonggiense]|uniref:Monosaccharide ABC transporter substrate-binding protein (CUT2 family) n=1 Tax=Amnibacterium kyonggiense TaxID=595671 RepID=A0A4R7FSF8_9MICO|nr:substrate-binding domain-containing protein [Amnibacterium kyonggiense]TDS80726.1 monosaccharide ABC transporter substrate-binding protein (CUT2 family) [Amnibacterium kyonggiense]
MTPRTRRLPTALAVAAAAAIALAGCSQSAGSAGTSSSGGTKQVSIALVRQLGTGDYYEQWLSGANAEAKKLGVNLTTFDADGDNAKQALNLQQATATKPGAIIIDHGFTDSLKAPTKAAIDARIPIVSFDVDTGNSGVTTVDQSDATIAKDITDKLVSETGGNAQVIYAYVAGYAPLDKRDAVWKAVKAKNPGLKQVAQVGVVNDSTAAQTADQVKAALQAHPGVTAILAPYDEFAKGAVQAVDELKLNGKVKVYGADISNADISAITAAGSPWVATAATDPANVGAVTVRAAYLKATGGSVDSALEVPPALITQDVLRAKQITTVPDLVKAFPDLATPSIAEVK